MKKRAKVPIIVTVSLSEITSTALNEKLRPLYLEALGGLQFIAADKARLVPRLNANTSLVILNLPQWSRDQVTCIQAIRDRGFPGPILMLVNDLDQWARQVATVPGLERVKLLGRPFENAHLIGYVRRLLAQETAHYRSFPRYETNQPVEMVSKKTIHSCTMKNVSRGGACVEFKGEPPVGKDEFVSLNVTLDDGTTLNNVRGRIAWVQKFKSTCGLEFVNQISL